MKNLTTNSITVIDFLNNHPDSTRAQINHALQVRHGGNAYEAFRVITHIRWKIGRDVISCTGNQYRIAASLSDILASVAKFKGIMRTYGAHAQIMLDVAEDHYPGDPAVAEQRTMLKMMAALLDA